MEGKITKICFPPFPIPEVTILPFKDFKEHGILLIRDESGQEVDGAGVPTVALPVQDEPGLDIEWPQSQPGPSFNSNARKEWWQYWEEYDSKRPPFAFNSQLPRLDRIFAAISSFRGCRRWPFERNGKPGPRYFWDQFRIFIGAAGYPPVWNRTDKPRPKEESQSVSSDYSDVEADASSKQRSATNIQVSTNSAFNGRRQQDGPFRPPYAYYNLEPVELDSDEAVRELMELDKLRREERLIDFLDDPEKAVKVFLSSYSRGQGFWWSDDNLEIMPRVIHSFFKFLLKNRVFPEVAAERKFQAVLRVAESALKELPFTSLISKCFPDEFGTACRKHWGSQSCHGSWSDDEGSDNGEGDAGVEGNDTAEDSGMVIPGCPELVRSKITRISFDDNEPESDTGREIPATTVTFPQSSSPIPPTSNAFQALLAEDNPFPVTHTLGFVEHSLRRIKRVLPPGAFASTHTKPHQSRHESIGTVNAVEKNLEMMLVKVVMAPWVDSGLYGLSKPDIVKCLKPQPGGAGHMEEAGEHEPEEDEITVLVSVASLNLDILRNAIGMGIAGTWVQLQPVDNKFWRGLKYWYLDELEAVIPSYWAC